MRVAREFRTSQPELYKYVPYTDSTPREVAGENAAICAWARRLCAILQTRHGTVPILAQAQILKSEVLAKEMLADPETLKRIRNMDLIRAAEIGILEPTDIDGTTIIPHAKRVLLKVLTLVIAFSVAMHDRTQPGNLPTP
jgi:hypothetical protein